MMHTQEWAEERTRLEDRHALAEMFAKRQYRKGAEIGVAQGYNAMMFLNNIPGLNLLCVDPWNLQRWDSVFPETVQNLSPYRGASIIRNFSVEAAKQIPDGWLDFVYIDGDHSYEACMADLEAWDPKVRKGGVIAGHDYIYFRSDVDVVRAVDDFGQKMGYELNLTRWNRTNPLRDERQPSFWFEKK